MKRLRNFSFVLSVGAPTRLSLATKRVVMRSDGEPRYWRKAQVVAGLVQ